MRCFYFLLATSCITVPHGTTTTAYCTDTGIKDPQASRTCGYNNDDIGNIEYLQATMNSNGGGSIISLKDWGFPGYLTDQEKSILVRM
jgi:hypothetical protein